jgi:ribonuclease T1
MNPRTLKFFGSLILAGLGLLWATLEPTIHSKSAPSPAPSTTTSRVLDPSETTSETEGVPSKALQVLAYVRRTGQAPARHEGGRIFENRERQLPRQGRYREYDVDPLPPPGSNRNAERLVVEEKSQRAWYTPNHYRTFIEIP